MRRRHIYIYVFIEECYRYGDKSKWSRKFPKRRIELEMVGENRLYWRGLGGGFFLNVEKIVSPYTYLKRNNVTSDEYRISEVDYLRLLDKYTKYILFEE